MKQPKRVREQREEASSCNEMMINNLRNAAMLLRNQDHHAIRTRSIGVHRKTLTF